jgi:FtsP/CotA-like multicopper oxidase with cupredoxin domain
VRVPHSGVSLVVLILQARRRRAMHVCKEIVRMDMINRRSVLMAGTGMAGAGLLAACTDAAPDARGDNSSSAISPAEKAVAAEKRRTHSGSEHTVRLTAAAATVDLGGRAVNTWSFAGQVPGKEIRMAAGDTLVAELANHLPVDTSVHWHGVALRNDMDGAPPITQRAVASGGGFTYRFVADQPGTYWYHPHVGVQLDRGLYGPLIVEDPHEPLGYDDEWIVVLDDWLDGVTGTPDEVLAEFKQRMTGKGVGDGRPPADDMTGMGDGGSSPAPGGSPAGAGPKLLMTGATSSLLGGEAGDVKYPFHLVNGKVPSDPAVYRGTPGRSVRLRIINAGGDTAYRVALGGHRMTLTHTDGYPVMHERVDALLIGMGERYDVLVTLQDGVFPLVAVAEGKNASGMALVRTGSGRAPASTVRPSELNGRILGSPELRCSDGAGLVFKPVDRTHRVELTGGRPGSPWSINGKRFDMADPDAAALLVDPGQRVRLEFVNNTMMWHPMHLHGHTFQVGAAGPRKDTVNVLPGKTVTCDFDADNPGRWLMHCHNLYHGEAGMMALVAYDGRTAEGSAAMSRRR